MFRTINNIGSITSLANKVRQEVSQMAKQKIDTFRGGQSLQEIAQFDWNEKFQSGLM
jgi:hypothetical protein